MRPSLRAALALTLSLPALAAAPAADLIPAMDIPPNLLIGGVTTPGSSPQMFDVVGSLGSFLPQNGGTMGLMFTGNVDLLPSLQDHDYPPMGAPGDTATLQFSLQVPPWAQSFSFKFIFCSREYPEWIGSEYNDLFEVDMVNDAWTDQIVFDAFGNPISINNTLFVVTDPGDLTGTGFDQDGCTGWVQTIAPVSDTSPLDLTIQIGDVGDGLYDSVVVMDDFSFSGDDPPDGPWTGEVPNPSPLDVHYASPKEGPLDGGGAITLRGENFTPDVSVQVGAAPVTDLTVGAGGDSLTLGTMPSAEAAGVADGGAVDIVVSRGVDDVTLVRGYTYWDESEGEIPPMIDEVRPPRAGLDGGYDVRVRGVGIQGGADVGFVIEGDGGPEVVAAEVLGVQPIEGGQEVLIRTPPMEEGWAELVLQNPDGLQAVPPFPFQFTADADVDPVDPGSRDPGCACTSGGEGGSWLWLLLLPLTRALQGRRRRR